MKIVTWNCNLNFANKFEHLESMDADICIIQECERLKEDYFPNASAVVVTILVVKAAVAHHHHHQTNNKILLTDFTDSTTLVLYEKTMFLSCSPVH